jgi:hypothetical protein
MKTSLACLALCATALVGAAPPSPKPMTPDAKLRFLMHYVQPSLLKETIIGLTSFGTRHTLSASASPHRGIAAALDWAEGDFKRWSAACNDCLDLRRASDTFTGSRVPTPTKIVDVFAIQRGTERPNDVVIIQGHIDSRVTDIMNSTSDAPGANDDGSGVAAVMEAARILSQDKFPGTIVYAALSGEEQGLYGGKVLAAYAKQQGWNVVAVLNNDIIGNSCSSDGVCDSTHARVLSEGPRSQGQAELAAATHSLGGENDSPSRNISRFLDTLADRLKIGLDVRQIWRTDRFGRGGDHIPFLELGYPAARISVAVENYDWQHQDLRTENGKKYGDVIENMDFNYLAKIVKLNVAALAVISSAPPPPDSKVEGAVATDTTIGWAPVPGAASYKVWWRRTDANNWQVSRTAPPCAATCKIVLPHIRVDDWEFGVSSVSKDGFESPVASAVPGGAFHPYIAPEKK